jgi:hypothetical protein
MTKTSPKVGDYVGFKYDVEQTGKIERIENDRYNGLTYYVRATHGEYVSNRSVGVLVALGSDEIW